MGKLTVKQLSSRAEAEPISVPVFQKVEELREQHVFRNLKALIYFTDGDGIYPEQKPDYETAFVFVRQTEKMNLVPKWAKKLLTEECTL